MGRGIYSKMSRSRPRRWVIWKVEEDPRNPYTGQRKFLCDPERKVGDFRRHARYALKFATKLEAETHIMTKMVAPEFIGKLRVTWTTER